MVPRRKLYVPLYILWESIILLGLTIIIIIIRPTTTEYHCMAQAVRWLCVKDSVVNTQVLLRAKIEKLTKACIPFSQILQPVYVKSLTMENVLIPSFSHVRSLIMQPQCLSLVFNETCMQYTIEQTSKSGSSRQTFVSFLWVLCSLVKFQ